MYKMLNHYCIFNIYVQSNRKIVWLVTTKKKQHKICFLNLNTN